MDEKTIWRLIDIYFRENPQALVRHHIDSYNQFFTKDIFQMFKEMNPLKLEVDYDDSIQDFRSKCLMYIGGKDASKIYVGKPIIHDPNNIHYMFPNECRLRNMTYASTIHFDVEIEYERILRKDDQPTKLDDKGYAIVDLEDGDEAGQGDGNLQKKDFTPSQFAELRENTQNNLTGNVQHVKMRLEKIYFGKFPIMLQSELCVLHKMPREMRYALGECKNDLGGYFIIDGKEKVVVPQEAFGDNMINVAKSKDEKYLYTLDIKSVSENVSKPIRTLSLRIMAPTNKFANKQIGVYIPNAGDKPIPLFIVFRALGILTDKEIISFCMLQNPEEIPASFAPYIDSCVHNASSIVTQYDAVKYISMFVKGRSITRTSRVLADYFLPHIGEVNFLEKAYYLGYLTNRLLSVATGIEPPTDRDSYKYKRLYLIGPLMKNLFREYYLQQHHHIRLSFETKYEFGKKTYADLSNMIYRLYPEIFRKRIVEEGFRKAFKGDWGASAHTKIVGILQDMNRLSHNGMINHLRKTNLPMDSSVKLVAPRVLHGSQWGIMDPIDTPDGGNVGLHKHLSMMTLVTNTLSREPLIEWLKTEMSKNGITIKELANTTPLRMGKLTKIFVNGYWLGGVSDPVTLVELVKLHRRHGLIPITVSVMFDYHRNTIQLSSDGGRLCRPVFYHDEKSQKFIFDKSEEMNRIAKLMSDPKESGVWLKMISGFHDKHDTNYDPYVGNYYKWEDLYKLDVSQIQKNKALLEYLDTQETEGTYIAMNYKDTFAKNTNYTHCEIHPSTTYGVMCNLINYLEHNPASRNSFSCGQSKQACSLYSTNYQLRMDKTAVVLNNGQMPLVRSRYLQYINNEENPYGENAIVAIMCYTGYNVEDAILINEGALQRGLFRTTYYTTYEAHEEKEVKNGITMKEKVFTNIDNIQNVIGIKPDFDYSKLDENGMIPENTLVDDRTVLIGQTEMADQRGGRKDVSKVPKKGQLGTVDKTFMTEGEEGQRIAKVRIREERIPAMGDKFASRAGQKGTIGMVIPEANMPFTKDGIRPDMIINPHALPSRMTIGQMIECIVGKGCAYKGTIGDCTAFYNRENKLSMFGEILLQHKFHSNGDEILYDGMNGKQLEASIFIGPTYYMRLKHMVKDKINFRARGPRTNLTRQPVSGRANDGGLRIGEMERDAVISHGMSIFLQESMMERADAYQIAVCNHSGMMAIYNPTKNILLSPAVDGPIKYSGSLSQENQQEVQQISKYGKSFSLVQVPYSMKLMMQELQAINVQVRVITEDNIDQYENLNFSHNLQLLTTKDATPKIIIERIKKELENVENRDKRDSMAVTPLDDKYSSNVEKAKEETIEDTPSPEIDIDAMNKRLDAQKQNENTGFNIMNYFKPRETKQESPDAPVLGNTPEESPQFDLNSSEKSPQYDPNSGSTRSGYESLYDPTSPQYASTSPAYAPTSVNNSMDSNQSGGNPSVSIPINSIVHYRGDVKPERKWKINKTGNKLYTIETQDLDYLTVEDSIKVVRPEEVYKPGMFDYPTTEKQSDAGIEELGPEMYAPIQQPIQSGVMDDAKINFAPVIKIFHDGNDMSQGGPVTNDQPQAQYQIVPETPAETTDKTQTETTSNDIVDFSKPIIIKKD